MESSQGIFCRAWPDSNEAYIHVGRNHELQLVEVVLLGLGRSNVLVLARHDALVLAEALRRAALDAGPGDGGKQ